MSRSLKVPTPGGAVNVIVGLPVSVRTCSCPLFQLMATVPDPEFPLENSPSNVSVLTFVMALLFALSGKVPVAPVGPALPVAPVLEAPVGPVGPVTTLAAPAAPVKPVGPVVRLAAPVAPVGPVTTLGAPG